MVNFGNDWDEILNGEFDKEYYLQLRQTLIQEYKTQKVYPDMYDLFNAMKLTAYKDVKCVILGQDPYHGEGQAHGLSFSVRKGIAPPPSLVNIFKEIQNETGINNLGKHGDLTKWANNGVLLLNTVLTVRAGQPKSHRGIGWEIFTTDVIKILNEREQPMVFMLWGGDAKAKKTFIKNKNHLVLTAAHPSPLSAYNGFFGCGHFVQANQFLRDNNIQEIDWSID